MKIIYNRFIPFKGFLAINLFGVFFVRQEKNAPKPKLSETDINHESIHTEQIKELGYIFFYILYLLEWIVKLFIPYYNSNAYRNISFEREAYLNANNKDYIKTRNRYSWIKYIL